VTKAFRLKQAAFLLTVPHLSLCQSSIKLVVMSKAVYSTLERLDLLCLAITWADPAVAQHLSCSV
jgi:hypothetical protein